MSKEGREQVKPASRTAEERASTDFAPKRDATIRIAVRLAGGDAPGEDAPTRATFWNTLHPGRPKDSPTEESPDTHATSCENAFKRNFGEGLRNGLLRNRDFRDGEPRRPSHGESPDSGITFWLRVGQVDYASLSFRLVVTGAAKFLGFFDNDVELCQAVIASLVPESLVWASSLGKYNSNEEAMDRIVSVEVDASSLEPFVPRPVQAPSTPAESKIEVAKSVGTESPAIGPDRPPAWRNALGGTLLVPVLLALGVLFAAFAFVRDEKASLRDERDALAKEAEERVSHERSALKEERAAIDARLEREVDREVERTNFWAQLGEDLAKQPVTRPAERKPNPPVVIGGATQAAADTKPTAGLPRP